MENIVLDKINIVDDSKYSHVDVCKRIAEMNPENDEISFFVCDLNTLLRKYFDMKRLMPRLVQYFAMKCNPNPVIVQTLASVGCNFECASEREIDQILQLKVNPNRILFGNPIKPKSHLEFSRKNNVNRMVYDTEDELNTIKKYFPDAELILRFRCNAEQCDFALGEKFGCDPDNEAPALLKMAKEMSLKVVGISFHVGSGHSDLNVHERAIKHAKKLFLFGDSIGFNFEILDIGGGLYGYSSFDVLPITNKINQALDASFPVESYSNIEIVSEFGQYYVATCCTLVCNILGKKIQLESSEGVNNKEIIYYVNDSVYKNFIVAQCEGVFYPLPKPLYKNEANITSATVIGYTLEDEDVLYKNIQLPEMNAGDWIVVEELGSYSNSISTVYGGFLNNPYYYIINEINYNKLKHASLISKEEFNWLENN